MDINAFGKPSNIYFERINSFTTNIAITAFCLTKERSFLLKWNAKYQYLKTSNGSDTFSIIDATLSILIQLYIFDTNDK